MHYHPHNDHDVEHIPWTRRATVYQVYPRSFYDTNGDGTGDLRGIIKKLDYLTDLGIGAIWLNPVYPSPMVDNGYDISDHYGINPLFGTLDDFDELVQELQKRDIKLIMDFVPNHTSDQNPWFLESRSSRNNPKRDWYIWRDGAPDGGPPNNWLSVFGGSAWTFDERTEQYYLHSFLKEQPDLNWRNPDVREEMFKAMRYWLQRGADGFRTDAIYHLMKDPDFQNNPDNPNFDPEKDDPYDSQLALHSKGHHELYETTQALCTVLAEKEEGFMISEAYLDIPEMMEMFDACHVTNNHAPMNFNFIKMPWKASVYQEFIDNFESSLDDHHWPNYVFGNHDRSRLASRIGRARLRAAAMLQLTLRGMPFIYYGEEIGMEDAEIPKEYINDPFEKNVPKKKLGRDPARTPMQWSDEKNAGFSDADPWLPVADNYKEINVEKQLKDPASLLSLYKKLAHLKRNSHALLIGSYRSVESGNDAIFSYVRKCSTEQLAIILNFSDEEQNVDVPLPEGTLICNTHLDKEEGSAIDPRNLTLRPNEGIVYLLQTKNKRSKKS